MPPAISPATHNHLLAMQQDEINSAEIYARLANRTKDEKNRRVLQSIADQEAEHAAVWETYTGKKCKVQPHKVLWFSFLSRALGFTFAVKYLEKREVSGAKQYEQIIREIPETESVISQEHSHELELMEMLDEKRLRYVGSIVLGMNDAMVELTGSLAGYTLAMQSTKLISLAGLITGISATLSMAASEYQSAHAESNPNALTSAMYTGITYLITVALLIAPFLLLPDDMYMPALGCTLGMVVVIVAAFNYYLSVAKDYPFKKRFLQMLGICLGVAAISFVIGLLVKQALGIDL